MSVVNTSNPLEDDNVQDVQLGREDPYGAGDSNMKSKADASKIVYINECFSSLSSVSFHITTVIKTVQSIVGLAKMRTL